MKKFLKFLIVVFISLGPTSSVLAQGDVMTTFSDAQFIAGVNWGTVTATNHSITISNAHIIPDSSGGPVGFTVEWGLGSPGGNSGDYTPINITQPYVLQGYGIDNYVFNITIGNLSPFTDYYFTIREINPYEAQSGTTDYGYNLFTYGFKKTNQISNLNPNFNYSNNNNTVSVSGNLVKSNGQALVGESIILQLREVAPGTTLDEIYQLPPNAPVPFPNIVTSPIITTSGPGANNGAGYFEYTFTNNVSPGSAYYLLIKRDIFEPYPFLVFPIYFEVPTPGSGNGNNPNTNPPGGGGPVVPSGPSGGLVPCTSPDPFDMINGCNFDKLIVLVNNFVDFLIFVIGFPLIAIIAAWAGVLLLTSGGSTGARDKAKSMFGHILIGLILGLLTWGIIKLILVTFGYQGPLIAIFGIG